MTDFSKQSRGRWFTVSVHTKIISHAASESFYAGNEQFALARFLREAPIVSLLLSGLPCWFTVTEGDPSPVVENLADPELHAFCAFPEGRFPNACVRCGRVPAAPVHQLESPPTPDTGDDDGTRASEEPDA